MENKSKRFLIFKILGIIGVCIAIFGLYLVFTGFGNFENNNFMIGSFMFTFGLFLGIFFILQGFKPEITKMQIENIKQIQEENKENLKDIINTNVDITKSAITNTTKIIKESFNDSMYCKHCGKVIDADSKFCNHCGKEQ